MKINLAKSTGFCVGVRRAIEIALQSAQEEKEVLMLGDIVHNEHVVQRIRDAGIGKICRLSSGRGKALLIRAHGAPEATILRAKRLGYRIIDATCPMVKGIHALARRMERERRHVIVIGERDHDEVRGIVGQLRTKATVIDPSSPRIPRWLGGRAKAAVVVQSTQDIEKVLPIVDKLKRRIADLVFMNTICRPTTTKQREARSLPRANDTVIVVGSQQSANTKRLFEIARSINPRTHWIRSKDEISAEWFTGAESVGVIAGASTPDQVTDEVIERIRRIR